MESQSIDSLAHDFCDEINIEKLQKLPKEKVMQEMSAINTKFYTEHQKEVNEIYNQIRNEDKSLNEKQVNKQYMLLLIETIFNTCPKYNQLVLLQMNACPKENEALQIFKNEITNFIQLQRGKIGWLELRNRIVEKIADISIENEELIAKYYTKGIFEPNFDTIIITYLSYRVPEYLMVLSLSEIEKMYQ